MHCHSLRCYTPFFCCFQLFPFNGNIDDPDTHPVEYLFIIHVLGLYKLKRSTITVNQTVSYQPFYVLLSLFLLVFLLLTLVITGLTWVPTLLFSINDY